MYYLLLVGLVIYLAYLLWDYISKSHAKKRNSDNHSGYQPKYKYNSGYQNIFRRYTTKNVLPFDAETIEWGANFLGVRQPILEDILSSLENIQGSRTSVQYSQFRMPKRRGGYRTISAPKGDLQAVQRAIYQRILLAQKVHPVATGFCRGLSIVDNAKAHLGHKTVLKIDLSDFFGTIKQDRVYKIFEGIGYPKQLSRMLSSLCCLNYALPQGAPTSPMLSNICAYGLDQKLVALANYYGLTYTRYADDLTFSGEAISVDVLLPKIAQHIKKQGFYINNSKTSYLAENKRKIITGISISSGEKLTIPKRKKRELRKIIFFIQKKGLVEHQKFIGSTDPGYLKRITGYLSFWLSVEPENQYVIDSLKSLRELEVH